MTTKLETLKISINEELFKALDKISGVCVKNVLEHYKELTDKNNKYKVREYIQLELFIKYYRFCKLNLREERNANLKHNENNIIENNIKRCTECFKKFILEDLIFISKK